MAGVSRSLRSDIVLMAPTRVVVLVCAVAASAVVARTLGPSGRGAVAVAVGFAMVLVQFGGLGIAAANPYFAAREEEQRARIVTNSLWLAGALGVVLVGAGAIVLAVAPDLGRGLGGTDVAIALGGVPLILAAQFLQGILLGEGRTVAFNAIDLATTVLTLVALVIGLAVLDAGVPVAISIMVGGRAVAALACVALLARGRALPRAFDRALGARMLRYAFRAYVAATLAYLVIRLDLLLVNAYLGSAEAGLYAVAIALADGMYLIPSVVAVNLFAHVARGLETETSARVFRSVALVYGAAVLVSVPLAGVFIRLVFGERFSGAVELYWWLAPGIFCLGMLNILAQHFAGRGFPLEAVLVWFVGLALNVAIILLFVRDGGTWVAALASSVAYAVLLFLHMRLFAREEGGYALLRPRWSDTRALLRAT
jgi:O-antigen/teichoic acid export membrane protein